MAYAVSFRFELLDHFSAKMRQIQGNSRRFMTSMQNASGKMQDIAGPIQAATAGMIGMGIAFPIRKAIEFETAVSDLDKAFNFDSAGQRAKFIADIKTMAPDLGITSTELAKLAFSAGKLGIALPDVAEFSQIAAQAAVAFDGLAIEDAGQVIGELRTRFNLTNQGVRELLDSVNTLADNTTADGGQILEVLTRLSGSFKTFKVPPEIAAGLATVARQIGITDELAASGMGQFFQKMIKSGKQMDLVKDPMGAITKELIEAKRLMDAGQAAVLQDPKTGFGQQAFEFVSALAGNLQVLESTMANVTDKTKFMGSAQAEYNRKTETTAFKLAKVQSQLDNLMIAIGDHLLPAIQALVTNLGPVLAKMMKFVEQHPMVIKISVAVLAIVAAVAAATAAVGLFMSVLTPVAALIGGMALLFSPWVVAIGGIIALAAVLLTAWQPIKDFFAFLWEGISSQVTDLTNWMLGIDAAPTPAVAAAQVTQGIPANDNMTAIGAAAATGVSAEAAALRAQQVQLNGQIGVAVQGPGRVTSATMQTSAPGNVGTNVAGVSP
jgi:TP901 family phage tail tape measure protein